MKEHANLGAIETHLVVIEELLDDLVEISRGAIDLLLTGEPEEGGDNMLDASDLLLHHLETFRHSLFPRSGGPGDLLEEQLRDDVQGRQRVLDLVNETASKSGDLLLPVAEILSVETGHGGRLYWSMQQSSPPN